jgi:dihydroorotate dehydrogenase (NAD+) catalytic subunit
VNIWGKRVEDYAEVASRFDEVPGVHGLELNISCPNIKEGGLSFGSDPRMAHQVTAAVRARTRLPLIPKLPPNSGDIRALARAVVEAGADAISLVNSFPALAIDVERRAPVLANVTGGLSGPALHPVAVKLVWEASQAVRVPIIGLGGITGPKDALEFLIAGATAVAVGTANFTDPTTCLTVIAGLEDYLQRHGLATVRELTGSLQLPNKT